MNNLLQQQSKRCIRSLPTVNPILIDMQIIKLFRRLINISEQSSFWRTIKFKIFGNTQIPNIAFLITKNIFKQDKSLRNYKCN